MNINNNYSICVNEYNKRGRDDDLSPENLLLLNALEKVNHAELKAMLREYANNGSSPDIDPTYIIAEGHPYEGYTLFTAILLETLIEGHLDLAIKMIDKVDIIDPRIMDYAFEGEEHESIFSYLLSELRSPYPHEYVTKLRYITYKIIELCQDRSKLNVPVLPGHNSSWMSSLSLMFQDKKLAKYFVLLEMLNKMDGVSKPVLTFNKTKYTDDSINADIVRMITQETDVFMGEQAVSSILYTVNTTHTIFRQVALAFLNEEEKWPIRLPKELLQNIAVLVVRVLDRDLNSISDKTLRSALNLFENAEFDRAQEKACDIIACRVLKLSCPIESRSRAIFSPFSSGNIKRARQFIREEIANVIKKPLNKKRRDKVVTKLSSLRLEYLTTEQLRTALLELKNKRT